MASTHNNTGPDRVSGSRLTFAGFEVDPANRVLSHGSVEVPLTAKTFDLLLAFVRKPNRLLSKDDLIEMVWPGEFVEEGNVARHVSTLRKALGDLPSEHRYITTVQGRGYKFVPEVVEVDDTAAELTAHEVGTAAEMSGQGFVWQAKHRPVMFVLALCVCLGLVFVTTSLIIRAPAASNNSIAVLPFRSIGPADNDLVYQLGLAESLIVRLGGADGITARPLSSMRKYSDAEQDAVTAGREQQVDYVLDSSYQLIGGKVRITSQLINVRTGSVEKTIRVEKDVADVFSMEDAIAGEIGNSLLAQLGHTAGLRATKHYTSNEEAYRLYLQGMILADKRNLHDASKAVELFEQAVKLDPNYALAFAGLAFAHRTVSTFDGVADDEYRLSKTAVDRALQLDPDLAEAHSVLGEIKSVYEWDHAGAELEYHRAVELDPNSAFAHRFYALHLINVGKFDKAESEINKAIDLDPHSVFDQRILGMVLYFAGRYDEAIVQLNRVLEMDPTHNMANFWLSTCYDHQGDRDQALNRFLEGMSHVKNPQENSPERLNSLTDAYNKGGWDGFLRHRLGEDFNDTTDLAFLNARLGNKDKAFEYLEKAYRDHDFSLIWLRVDPNFNSLHSDPRFQDLIRRLGLNVE